MALCAGLLVLGHYKWLDKIIKVVVVVLTVTTLLATLAVMPKLPWDSLRLLPAGDWITTTTTAVMLCALVGWMPSAFDISVWHSLWTLARRRETGQAPSVDAALTDFNIGYLGTVLLALCFMMMGAGTMFESGESFAAAPAAFAAQIVRLYTENLGEWTGPIVTLAAFAVMFSTTLTVIDGLPRALATLLARFRGAETPGEADAISRNVYWAALGVLFVGSMIVIEFFIHSLTTMVDVATVLSLLTAPALAWLNHRAITSDVVPTAARPGPAMRAWSWCGILISLLLASYFVIMRWVIGA